LERFFPDFKDAEAYIFSNDPDKNKIGHVLAVPWEMGMREIGLGDYPK